MPFGVDLGTTNSSIAWADDEGNVHSLRVRQGPREPFDAVERSLVLDPLGDDPSVGAEAAKDAQYRPEDILVHSFKRRFDKQRLRERRYEVTRVPTREYDAVSEGVRLKEVGRWVDYYDDYSRPEIVASGGHLFRTLLTAGEIDVPESVVVRTAFEMLTGDAGSLETLYIGVPVAFGPTARRRLLAALVRSGCFGSGPEAYAEVLRRCRLVYEPLALISTLTIFEPQNVLVVDFGGGTLDLAVLHITFDSAENRIVKELALAGLSRAGDLLDALFRDHLLEKRPRLRRAYKRQVAHGSWWDQFEANSAFSNAKIRLSSEEEAYIPLFNETATRAEFEDAIGPEIQAALQIVRQTIAQAGLGPEEIGTVLLTGGSSLVPLVQERIRDEFPTLDELGYDPPDPRSPARRLGALTGVSRGLARFGFGQRFETSAPGNFTMYVPGVPGSALCLPRGSADVESLEDSPCVTVPVKDDRSSTFVLHSDLVRETYCGALVDVRLPRDLQEVEVRTSASRSRFIPAFELRAPGSRSPLVAFDLEAMKPSDVAEFVEGDCEWLPAGSTTDRAPLVRPLAVNDLVAWKEKGGRKQGKIVEIRDLHANHLVDEMQGFDLGDYAFKVAVVYDGVVELGRIAKPRWHPGDVRLA
jgi:Hsp70 protein